MYFALLIPPNGNIPIVNSHKFELEIFYLMNVLLPVRSLNLIHFRPFNSRTQLSSFQSIHLPGITLLSVAAEPLE